MTPHKTVLVPLDGSVRATAAIPVARGFAELLRATIVILHVSDDALEPAALIERMKLSSQEVQGLVVEQRTGAAAAAITREASERQAAMIVMCPRVRTDLPTRALGTVAAAVLRTAPCPVVLVPSGRGRKHWGLHRLLVPHDGTPTSAATMGPATDFASMAAAELVVLHVATPGAERAAEPGTLLSPRYVDQPQHEWRTWAQEFVDRLRALGGARDGVKVDLMVAQGDAGSAIVNFARQSDLIVLGWRGVLEPDRARTLRRVIRDTTSPVIVFRLDQER
ncbi:MAG TPA: universal stress protein [Xanthobacteraceae bacterium]|nr:universal stress protein [Xanthobacteraceae bacterium]